MKMSSSKAVTDSELTLLSLEADGSWTLRHFAKPTVLTRYSRLIDAIYERERLRSGGTPPFGRWIIHGTEEVKPLRFDGESDEQMQSDATRNKTLYLRDWEYEELVDRALGRSQSDGDGYSDEFETKFHHSVQQRSVAPFMSGPVDEAVVMNQRSQVNDEQDAPCATGRGPFYKRHPIIFWTLIGALLTGLGSGYKKYQMNERIKAEQNAGR
jgi:hypothetical protein